MASIYAMSDIHGNEDVLEANLQKIGFPKSSDDVLVLCGDYLDHSWENDICDFAAIMDVQARYPEGQVVVLAGNHEVDWLSNHGGESYAGAFARWITRMPLYYETEDQIFVHAGIDEEAGDLWRVGTPDEWFTHKFPPETGSWDDGSGNKKSKDIIAGHVSVRSEYLGGYHHGACVYHDGENHFFIDGCTESTGVIPILEYDMETKTYYAWNEDGDRCPLTKR